MTHVPIGLALKSGVTGGIVAAVINILLFEVAHVFLRMSFFVPQGADGALAPLTVLMVVLASLIPGLVAAVLFWGLLKASRHGLRLFSVGAYTFLAISLFGPFSMVRPISQAVVLSLMHVVAALIIVRKLKKAARDGVTVSEPAQTIQPMAQ